MTRIPVHDVDLHHSWASDESLAEYMPSEWKQYFNGSGEFAPFPGYGRSHPAHVRYPVVTGSGMRPARSRRTEAAPGPTTRRCASSTSTRTTSLTLC